jgi:type I restriction enzyme M protein
VISDHKEERRSGKVQLIDARELWEAMPRSLGDKRRRLSLDHIDEVLELWRGCDDDGERSKVRDNDFFGYQRIVVERPLRLRYRGGEGAVGSLWAQSAFQKLAEPAKSADDPDAEREAGEGVQQALIDGLRSLNGVDTTDRSEMERALKPVFADAGKLSTAVRKTVWEAVSERDSEAPIVTGKGGKSEPDPTLRDKERVPLQESIEDYMAREVAPFAPDAWDDQSKTKIGYEIPLTRLFYRYQPPRPLEEIDAEIRSIEDELAALLPKGPR